MSYDFRQLSPHDLELLVRDLLQADWGVKLESFKTGKDHGIDLRYARAGKEVVVQCKHYVESGIGALRRAMREEADKVRRLAPVRYVLVTSTPLSPKNKDEIVQVVGEELLVAADVIGADDLNNLLGVHPDVERRHFKLWLGSRTVLDKVLHNAAFTRSELKVEQVQRDARRYVPSKAYPEALSRLDRNGVVIVAGPPGVGKTTLANLLLYVHLERGYQAVVIDGDVREGLDLFQAGTKQVFHFDDFLGATFLGDDAAVWSENRDRGVVDLLRTVQSSPGARLIVTTREHIYAQAKARSERLREADLDEYRVVLRMRSYSMEQRAEILYNHLYFGDLPAEYLGEILRSDFFLGIVKHAKFNPRIVDWLSSYGRVRRVAVEDYRTFVGRLLDDPTEIWRHAYERQISDAARSMLLALFSLGGSAGQELLSDVFAGLHEERCRIYGIVRRPEDFRSALRELIGAFVTLQERGGVRVLDPSVLDLMNTIVGEAPDNAADIVAAAREFGQVERVWGLSKTAKGSQIQRRLARSSDRLVGSIRDCMAKPKVTKVGTPWYGWALEERLPLVIEMADAMPGTETARLVVELFDRIAEAWNTRGPQFDAGRGILNAIAGSRALRGRQKEEWSEAVRAAMLGAMEDEAYVSDELLGMASMVDEYEAPEVALKAVRRAFEEYKHQIFSQEIAECRSADELDTVGGFLDDLQAVAGVEVESLSEELEEAKEELRKGQSDLAEHFDSDWEERRATERARSPSGPNARSQIRQMVRDKTKEGDERSVRDMFDSLS